MSDIPLPQPLTDDEAAELDYLYENYEADHREGQWADALEWARKGDFAPLVECLRRTDFPLDHPDVRNWLADGLADRFKKPDKVAKRPVMVPFELANGRTININERHLKQFEAMRLAEQLMVTMDRKAAIEKAADVFEVEPPKRFQNSLTPADTLSGWLGLARSKWGLPPVKSDGMFDDVVASLKKD
ncbi:hypothetical protein [Tardiphaga sp. vice278]|uniref:hypothetical protein n=1 Tax=Tardiphaga sp. vice278 TaxID=2592815 RepID=UPI001164A4F3|nr:hypothetical protein [Tardiphaga sp. vice278]QDM16844.1 hypothetical protein FNL53_13565 [Tardiphaga sp. vice278]